MAESAQPENNLTHFRGRCSGACRRSTCGYDARVGHPGEELWLRVGPVLSQARRCTVTN
jgi:hypothetical protein